MKKKIEKHSINAIHRKFYTKILKQKDRLSQDLATYNDSVAIHTRNNTIDLADRDPNKKDLDLSMETRLKIRNHPLMKEINSTLIELKKSLPTITSKLTWDKPLFYKKSKYDHLRKKMRNRSRTNNQCEKKSQSEDVRKRKNSMHKQSNNEYEGKFWKILII